MERVDKHVGAVYWKSSCDATIAESGHEVPSSPAGVSHADNAMKEVAFISTNIYSSAWPDRRGNS